jgi:hypothetical protein
VREWKKRQQERIAFQYVANALYCLTTNRQLQSRFEFIDFEPKKEKSPEEIKENIKAKFRG